VEELLILYPDAPIAIDAHTFNPLHYAAYSSASREVLELLLHRDPEALRMVNEDGDSALHVACRYGLEETTGYTIRIMINGWPVPSFYFYFSHAWYG
jgi:ankyrin repeat protein